MQRKRASVEQTSCQSCRARKLRCSRTQPCTNCTQRKLICRFATTSQARTPESLGSDHQSQLLGRIEHLEHILLSRQVGEETGQVEAEISNSPTTEPSGDWSSREKLFNSLVHADFHYAPQPAKGKSIAVNSLVEILEFLNTTQHLRGVQTEPIMLVPPFTVAARLLQVYEDSVGPICCILHGPTTRTEAETFYLRVMKHEEPEPGLAAMITSVLSLSMYFCRESDLLTWTISETDSTEIASYLHDVGTELLEHAIRSAKIDLHAVQAAILLTYFIHHRDGHSPRYRRLVSTAGFLAKELRLLYEDDSSPHTISSNQKEDLMMMELQRRVIWHLASSEWLTAPFSCSQEGMQFARSLQTLMLQPSEFPTGAHQPDIQNINATAARPTGVTYFLARIKLAMVCRRVTDLFITHGPDLSQIPYDQIITQDKELVRFLQDLPYFFRLDHDSLHESAPLESIFGLLPIMRYTIATTAHSRRLRLHQPYLLRQRTDERYTYSRSACVDSATSILAAYDSLPTVQGQTLAVRRAHVGIAASCTHLALATLVVDWCFNQDQLNAVNQPYQLSDAFYILEKVGAAPTTLLGRSLQLLHATLSRHGSEVASMPAFGDNVNAAVGDQIMLEEKGSVPQNVLVSETLFHPSDAELLDELLTSIMQYDKGNYDEKMWERYFAMLDTL